MGDTVFPYGRSWVWTSSFTVSEGIFELNCTGILMEIYCATTQAHGIRRRLAHRDACGGMSTAVGSVKIVNKISHLREFLFSLHESFSPNKGSFVQEWGILSPLFGVSPSQFLSLPPLLYASLWAFLQKIEVTKACVCWDLKQ